MIQTVPTGDLGLDLLLGGGWRLVTRLGDHPSATVVVRGSTGVGKSLVALNAALSVADALEGDVVVACVEILPIEYVEQLRHARPDIDEQRVVALPGSIPAATGRPRVVCALLTDLDPHSPDLVAALEILADELSPQGVKPSVFVVDSLIEGYGIGSSSQRPSADELMKFAAQRGCGLFLCEEAVGDERSPWVFAADTVLELGMEPRERGRWCEVRKHRFGPSATGRHELALAGPGRPRVFPQPRAWVSEGSKVLLGHGWTFGRGQAVPPLAFEASLGFGTASIRGAVALVSSGQAGLSRRGAFGLAPEDARPKRDLVLEMDPLILREDGSDWSAGRIQRLPTICGAPQALCLILEQFARVIAPDGGGPAPNYRRVLLGDLGLVLSGAEALEWVEAMLVFASLAYDSGWGVPIVMYDGGAAEAVWPEARHVLAANVDAWIHLMVDSQGHVRGRITERWGTRRPEFMSSGRADEIALSGHLPPPPRR